MNMNIRTIFGLAAIVGLVAVAAPVDRAQAVSLINPAASTSAQLASDTITEVNWGHHRGWHHGRHRGWHHRHWHHRHHWHRRHHWY